MSILESGQAESEKEKQFDREQDPGTTSLGQWRDGSASTVITFWKLTPYSSTRLRRTSLLSPPFFFHLDRTAVARP